MSEKTYHDYVRVPALAASVFFSRHKKLRPMVDAWATIKQCGGPPSAIVVDSWWVDTETVVRELWTLVDGDLKRPLSTVTGKIMRARRQ